MTDETRTIRDIDENDVDQLLPGGGAGATLVLFVDATCRALALEHFTGAARAVRAQACVAEAERVPRLVRWFGITQFPALAMICDGVLLGIETECDDGGCERVLARARDSLDALWRA